MKLFEGRAYVDNVRRVLWVMAEAATLGWRIE